MVVSRVSHEDEAPPAQAADGGYVGRSVGRVEDSALLIGAGHFVDDINRRGQLWARMVRSEVAHGRIVSIDAAAARRRRDVVAVVTADDIPDVRIPIRMIPSEEAERVLQPPLARGVARYVGEPVAVVVANGPYAAEDAAGDVLVEMDPLESALDGVGAARAEAPRLHAGVEGNVINTVHARHGAEVDALFARAAVVVRERLHVHRHSAIPMETRGLVAEYDSKSARLTVWGQAKVKHFNLRALARLLGMPGERIRFIEPEVGGGFGVRGELYPEDFLVPWLAIQLGRPVKWVEDRAEHFVATNHAREQDCEIEMAADSDGRLLAFRARCWVNQGAYARTHGGILLPKIVVDHIAGPYIWEGFEVDCASVLTNKTPAGTYRGPSQYEATFFRERTIDLVAARLDMDPAELRRRNLVPLELMPYEIEIGEGERIVYDCGDFPRTWQRLLDETQYEKLRPAVDVRRSLGEQVGIGVAAYVEAGGFGPFESAHVVPLDDGRFLVHVGIASLGQGVQTGLAQIAADALKVPIDRIQISHHDTDVIPEGMGAYASRTTILGGNAIVGAVRDLHLKAVAAAADRHEMAEIDLEVAGETVRSKGSPDRGVSLASLGCEGEFRYEKPIASFAMGGCLALVSADRETGGVRVERYSICHDVGRVVNPRIVDGQFVGAGAQGVAGALLEELVYDQGGQPLSTSFMDYLMPTACEAPPVNVTALELEQHNPASANPLGVKGCAESGIIGAAAAVANALADALGQQGTEIRSLPLAPETVLTVTAGTSPSTPEREIRPIRRTS